MIAIGTILPSFVVAIVEHPRPPVRGSAGGGQHGRIVYYRHRRRRAPYVLGLIALVLAALAGVAFLVSSSSANITPGASSLATVNLPIGGGKIESVVVLSDRDNRAVPIVLRGQEIWPQERLPANQRYTVYAVVKRPGWISWLSGSTKRIHLTLTTPTAHLTSHYLTLASGAPLRLQFEQPVATISYGATANVQRHVLPTPESDVTLPRTAEAGTMYIAATSRSWESSNPSLISWFPTGATATAVANPAPGTKIQASTPISLTFSKPVSQALGNARPPVAPATAGSWHTVNDHTIVFRPAGYGYGLGANVSIGLPNGIRLVGGQRGGASSAGTWTVPPGSTLGLQELLAQLGYLPLDFHYPGGQAPHTAQALEDAAIHPPKTGFTWRWGNIPSGLRSMWAPGVSGVMTKGAVMAFENDHGMNTDGVAGPAVWNAMIGALLAGHRSTFGYTFVTVSEGSPETESTWHNGGTAATGLVNTGIPGAATALGTYPVFEHSLSVTMSGTNPDGSTYSDPGVPYVSYFNGGDALHGFLRGSYGSPQSLGCVEMDYSQAAKVYPYTPIGTLVSVVA